MVGLLYLDNYRQNLIQSELELLKTEAKLFSGALAASGVVTGPLGEERLLPETTRQTVRRLVDVSQTRARLFSPDGVADRRQLPAVRRRAAWWRCSRWRRWKPMTASCGA